MKGLIIFKKFISKKQYLDGNKVISYIPLGIENKQDVFDAINIRAFL